METRAHYAAVGAFVLTMIALAFAAVLWLARSELNTQYAYYNIYFTGPVTGLRKGAAVEYNGLPVGRVDEVVIAPENVALIRVTIEIDSKVVIKTDAKASVETNILSGVSFIQIVGGTEEAPVLQAKGNERYPVIPSTPSRLASVAAAGPQLVNKLNETADRINDLLDEKNRRALAESLDNLRQFTSGLADRSKDLEKIAGNANAAIVSAATLLDNIDRSYSGEDGIGRQLATAIADFDRVAKNLNDTNKQLQLALQDVRPGLRNFSQQTLGDIGSLVAETRQLVAGLNRVAVGLERDPSSILFGDRREGYRPR
jgi:phospholipid/cholesterol/gamma-HCH transport system substrate-binding protein